MSLVPPVLKLNICYHLAKEPGLSHLLGISDANIWGEEILGVKSPLAHTLLLLVHEWLGKSWKGNSHLQFTTAI